MCSLGSRREQENALFVVVAVVSAEVRLQGARVYF